MAFYETQNRADQADTLPAPESFAIWRDEASKTLQDQPALERLLGHFDQLHRMARLVILKTPEGSSVTPADYDAVSAKYQDLVSGLRRMERAFSTAAAGLDTLTGLRSRAGMREDLTRELSRFQRTGKPFCLALLDIDHFKNVNDTHGHESGDKVLSAVADYLSRSLRPFDDAWRWGGEEILICLKEADLSGGQSAVERVRSGLSKLPIRLADGQEISITASFGLTMVQDDVTVEEMIAQADKALYQAKTNGRNRVETASA